jgi:ATP-dependent Lhr-like helicase
MLQVRLTRHRGKGGNVRGGPILGKIEEGFLESLTAGDTFLFSGRTLRFEGIRENICYVSNANNTSAKIPSYVGGKFPLSTFLAAQVRAMLADSATWKRLPKQVGEWLNIQKISSILPGQDELLVETFPRDGNFYMIIYPFEGRLAHQTLGMLLTRRLERAGTKPLGFVATDYALAIWGLRDLGQLLKVGELSLSDLFDEDMLGDDLEEWLAGSFLLKRTFRQCATIAGLIEKRHPGKEKSGRQMTVSSDLIYDVLRTHEPDHLLLQATRDDAAKGLLDIRRLGDMLRRIKSGIIHQDLERISPLAIPIMLEIGKEPIAGEAQELLLAEAAEELMNETGK